MNQTILISIMLIGIFLLGGLAMSELPTAEAGGSKITKYGEIDDVNVYRINASPNGFCYMAVSKHAGTYGMKTVAISCT